MSINENFDFYFKIYKVKEDKTELNFIKKSKRHDCVENRKLKIQKYRIQIGSKIYIYIKRFY